jgi:hypothetical protein
MTEDQQGRQRKRRRIWFALAAIVVVLAVVFVPPFVSVSRYKTRITSLISASLGRPVRLSQVSVRLLPRPAFILSDLTVDEDPEFGGEALLHASTVTADIRLLPLWRGRLQISEISVDEASLNLVRSTSGRWNLDPLFHTAANKAGSVRVTSAPSAPPLPYLAATNSRINFKNGAEKLPFSLVATDLSFWQENPGEWRIRLRGQPARTDVSLDLADTGVVELNASAHSAAALSQMPIQLDLEWRDAQLGQLTRLVTGSDAGWRGDLRGDVHIDGTPDAANVKARLRAAGVHRAEFAPVAPMDFDANCGFLYHYDTRALEKLVCDSPLGDGHVEIAGQLPGIGTTAMPVSQPASGPQLSVALDKVPVAAALDALRTVRSGVGTGLEASGTASGKITYADLPPATGVSRKPARAHPAKTAQPLGPLGGSFTVDGFQLKGDGFSTPIVVPKAVLSPATALPGQPQALVSTVTVPMGGPAPIAMNIRIGLAGYQITARGPVSVQRSRELAHAAGLQQAPALDSLAGDPITVDLLARGPWLPAADVTPDNTPPAEAPAPAPHSAKAAPVPVAPVPPTDNLSGTITLHNDNWKADFLANPVEIAAATLQLTGHSTLWDPIEFSYGTLKGTAVLTVPGNCDTPTSCTPNLELSFGDLDAATVQTSILGAREKGTLLSDLLNRLHPSAAPVWPRIQGTVKADSLLLGPVTLKGVSATIDLQPAATEITTLEATLLGGSLHASGRFESGDKPYYELDGDLTRLDPAAVGLLLGEAWRGGTFAAKGKIQLSGFTASDLAGSARGTLHFAWHHGAIPAPATVPASLAHFDLWSADATIANGKISLDQNDQNQAVQGSHKHSIDASVTLAEPAKVTFAPPKAVPTVASAEKP